MNLDNIDFKINDNQGYYDLQIKVNQDEIIDYKFLDLFPNLLSLVELGFVLQQQPVKTVHYLNDCDDKAVFKISPNPPMDWLVLGIPTTDSSKKFYLDRLNFCEKLKEAIEQFMQDMNLDYIGNPNMRKDFQDNYVDEIWKIIGHKWLD